MGTICKHNSVLIAFEFSSSFQVIYENGDVKINNGYADRFAKRDGTVTIQCRDCAWRIVDAISNALHLQRTQDMVRAALVQTIPPSCAHPHADIHRHRFNGRVITGMYCPDCQSYMVQTTQQ